MKNTIGRYVTPVYFFSHILVQNGCVMNLEADKKDFSSTDDRYTATQKKSLYPVNPRMVLIILFFYFYLKKHAKITT